METSLFCQEILIMHHSRFFTDKLQINDDDSASFEQQLADACWRGLIQDILPEINPSISLTEINKGNSFLDLRYIAADQTVEEELSINPYLFLGGVREN